MHLQEKKCMPESTFVVTLSPLPRMHNRLKIILGNYCRLVTAVIVESVGSLFLHGYRNQVNLTFEETNKSRGQLSVHMFELKKTLFRCPLPLQQ